MYSLIKLNALFSSNLSIQDLRQILNTEPNANSEIEIIGHFNTKNDAINTYKDTNLVQDSIILVNTHITGASIEVLDYEICSQAMAELQLPTSPTQMHKPKNQLKQALFQTTHNILNTAACKFLGKRDQTDFVSDLTYREPDLINLQLDDQNRRLINNVNYIDVDYIHQPRINECMDTCVAMQLNYHYKKCREINFHDYDRYLYSAIYNFNKRTCRFFSGKATADVKKYTDMLLYNCLKSTEQSLDIEILKFYLYKHGPIIARFDRLNGHVVLIKGIVDECCIVHDPWKGPNRTITFNAFHKEWDGSILSFKTGYSFELITQNQPLRPLPLN